jgi:hypothetical protein
MSRSGGWSPTWCIKSPIDFSKSSIRSPISSTEETQGREKRENYGM